MTLTQILLTILGSLVGGGLVNFVYQFAKDNRKIKNIRELIKDELFVNLIVIHNFIVSSPQPSQSIKGLRDYCFKTYSSELYNLNKEEVSDIITFFDFINLLIKADKDDIALDIKYYKEIEESGMQLLQKSKNKKDKRVLQLLQESNKKIGYDIREEI